MTVLPPAPSAAGDGDGAGVGDDVPVEHLDAPPGPGGDRVVVGDDDDRGPGGVELFQQGQDRRRRWPSPGCRWARRPAAPAARPRPPGRSRPAAARPPDSWVGRAAARCPSPTRSSACSASRRRSARRTPAYSSPSATLPSTLWCSARKNCWNTNPIRDARSADSCRSVIRATSIPVTRTVPAGGLVQGAHQVQQRGLARPRRADDRGQLPGRHRQAHPVQRPHRRLPRVHLRHPVQLQYRYSGPARPRGPGPSPLRS